MTPDGARRSASMKSTYTQYTGFNNFEDLGPCDRCIARGPLGSMFPVVYNNGNQIFQAPGLVVLRNEMIHETRIIPLDGRPHVGKSIRSYMGDSRGRWDGNTLVVTTTNLNGQTGAQGNGNILQLSAEGVLTERFTRVAVDTIQYDVTSTTRRHGRARGRPRFRFTGSRVRDVRVRLSRGKLRTDILSASRADERAKEK
jgi:hypothetical protein